MASVSGSPVDLGIVDVHHIRRASLQGTLRDQAVLCRELADQWQPPRLQSGWQPYLQRGGCTGCHPAFGRHQGRTLLACIRAAITDRIQTAQVLREWRAGCLYINLQSAINTDRYTVSRGAAMLWQIILHCCHGSINCDVIDHWDEIGVRRVRSDSVPLG